MIASAEAAFTGWSPAPKRGQPTARGAGRWYIRATDMHETVYKRSYSRTVAMAVCKHRAATTGPGLNSRFDDS